MSRSPFVAVIMQEQGVSQGELVRRTRLSKPTVMDAYHGREVSPYTMAKIAKALSVPLAVIDPDAANELDGLVIN
jgi:transcriptional regulator with XRE-family HTH domain